MRSPTFSPLPPSLFVDNPEPLTPPPPLSLPPPAPPLLLFSTIVRCCSRRDTLRWPRCCSSKLCRTTPWGRSPSTSLTERSTCTPTRLAWRCEYLFLNRFLRFTWVGVLMPGCVQFLFSSFCGEGFRVIPRGSCRPLVRVPCFGYDLRRPFLGSPRNPDVFFCCGLEPQTLLYSCGAWGCCTHGVRSEFLSPRPQRVEARLLYCTVRRGGNTSQV